jgi:hypothetical protein
MKKLLLGSLVGGIALFLWGWLSWVIPIHTGSIHTISNEDTVMTAMQMNMEQRGVYIFPGMPTTTDKAVVDEYSQKYKDGPVGMIIYDPEGSDPMSPAQMIIGFIISFLSAFFVAWFLSRSTAAASTYIARVAYCGMLGIFVSVSVHLVNWNWMGFPPDYTVGWIIDTIIGWLVAGLVISAIIKIRKPAEAGA